MTLRFPARAATAVAVVSLLLASLAVARSGGIYGRAEAGCGGQGCHIGGRADIRPTLSVPDQWTPDASYTLNISVAGARDPALDPENEGGFSLEVRHGRLRTLGAGTQVSDDTQATHTADGNDRRRWRIGWDAPSEDVGEITFWLAVNAVDGDGQASAADQWNTLVVRVPGPSGQGGAGPRGRRRGRLGRLADGGGAPRGRGPGRGRRDRLRDPPPEVTLIPSGRVTRSE